MSVLCQKRACPFSVCYRTLASQSGVLATQLWHHLYLSESLCDLLDQEPYPQIERPIRPQMAA